MKMKIKRIACLALSCAMVFGISVNASAVEESEAVEDITVSGDNIISASSISEYEMAIQETEVFLTEGSTGDSPLEEYKENFDIRASMSEDELRDLGYTDDMITALQEYNDGEISFEEAATRASSTITTTLSASIHTSSKYTISYSWSWSSAPTAQYKNSMAIGLVGINSESQSINSLVTSQGCRVLYYKGSSIYSSESLTPTTDGGGISVSFDAVKVDSTSMYNLYAKEGLMIVIMEPVISSSSGYEAVNARAAYLKTKATVDYSVIINATIFGSIILSVDSSISSTCTEEGVIDRVFYNDGSTFDYK